MQITGLEGKVAVVTGAGRMRSIGRPIAVELARAGCDIVLTGAFVQVEPRRFRPFQGWRYLDPKEAPADLRSAGARDLPPEFVKELAVLGLL